MKRTLLATLALLTLTVSAQAQRCPAGADAFLNCLPLNHQGYRATNEISIRQQEYARSHSGRTAASAPPLVTGTTPTLQGVRYSMDTKSFGRVTFIHHRDGKRSTFTMADGKSVTMMGGAALVAARITTRG